MKPLAVVIDDQAVWRHMVQSRLATKFEVLPAASGEAAVEMLSMRRPALIVIDEYMEEGKLQGHHVLEWASKQPALSGVPVLMLTDLPLVQSAFKWTSWTKVDHVQKPHFDQQFDARVDQLLALASNWPFESDSETMLSLVMRERAPVDIVVGVIESHMKTKDVLGLDLDKLKARGRAAYVGDWQSNARKLGTQLYRTLLKQPEITRAIDSAIARQQRINIAGNLDLLEVPLELIRDESGRDYHVLHYPFSRSVLDVRAPRGYAAPLSPRLLNDLHRQGMRLRVLLIAANTGNIPRVDDEIDAIRKILESNPKGLGIDIKVLRNSEATLEAVSRQLQTGSYHIVHYAGHGEFVSTRTDNHRLVLTRTRDVVPANGQPQGQPDAIVREYLTATQLSVLWSKNPPSLFYMSACWGAATGPTSALLNNDLLGLIDAAISAGVPSVIGFRWPVSDQGAFALSKVFYQELMASGRPDHALRTARVHVYSSPQPDAAWLSPVLVMQPP